MITDTLKPDFSLEMRGRICEATMNSAKRAIERRRDGDDQFLLWDQQAEGDPLWAGIPPRWRGGCDVEDPMTDEHLFEIVASVVYIQRQQEWYQVTEVEHSTEESEGAQQIEDLMNDLVTEARLNTQHLYDLAENAARHSYAVLCIEWEQKYKTQYRPVYRHKEKETLHETGSPEVLNDPDSYALTEEIHETVEHEGIKCRVPYTGDVYLDPPSAQSFSEARRVIERFDYTEDDLINGITDFGFDEKQVEELLKSGPTKFSDRTYRSERDEIEGVDGEEDTWEVLRIIGQPPVMLKEGKSELKEEERRRDYQWMVCPSHNICFKFAPSGYVKRPYAKFPFRGRPGRFIGHSVCSMLAPLQQEATNAFRFTIDFRDLYMSSPLLVPDSWYNEVQWYSSYPGSMMPYPTNPPIGPGAIQPLPYNPSGFQAGIASTNQYYARADQLFSSDARGPAQIQNRTATEVAQSASGADEKLDLILMNFHLGVEEAGDIILSHYQQFGGEMITRRIGEKTVQISAEMLRKRYRIQATGSSENASPIIRERRTQMIATFAQQDPILAQKVAQGDMTGVYQIMSRLYRAAGIRDPKSILGGEPTAPPNSDYLLQMLLQIAAQFAKQGDQGCLFIIQKAQQMMASRQQNEGAPVQGAPQQQGKGKGEREGVSASVKYEDLAPNQQQVFAQKILGLPPGQPNPQNNGGGFPPQGVAFQ